MKERPIIFSGEMVKAILDGRKTQTRRVIIPQPNYRPYLQQDAFYVKNFGYIGVKNKSALEAHLSCPYGQVGDRLWVKETWQAGCEWDDEKPSQIDPLCGGADINYIADGIKFFDEGWGKIRSSYFMPKWAARIWLEITNIRVEKLRDISGKDAQKEGWPRHQEIFPSINTEYKAKSWFAMLWNQINVKRGYGWDTNPWVWIIEFKKL